MAAESQYHVLVVDDSLIDRNLIERLLRISSYEVTAIDSRSMALEFLGLHENDESKPNTPLASPINHQCNMPICPLDPDTHVKFVENRPFNDKKYYLDRMDDENVKLGWFECTTGEEGLRKTMDWYVKNPNWLGRCFWGIASSSKNSHHARSLQNALIELSP